MSLLSVTRTTIGPLDQVSSRITDLIVQDGMLYSTTRSDGQIVSWSLADLIEDVVLEFPTMASGGAEPMFAVVNDQLLLMGWTRRVLVA